MEQKTDNKDVVQSYIWTVAKHKANIYEKRVFYRIIEAIQSELEGKPLKHLRIEKTIYDDRVFTMPISLFLKDEKDENYTRIKKALLSLRNRTIEFDDGKVWKLRGFIEKPNLYSRGSVTFEITPEVYSCMLNFTKGFRKYELKTAMSFNSEYSMRFYELMSGQKEPITYKIDKLKEMFGKEGKYKQVNDFLKRIVVPAQKELDEKSPYTFTYRVNKKGRKFDSITFYPKYQPQHRDDRLEQKELDKKVSLSWDFTTMEKAYLIDNFDFSTKEIKNNLETFKEFKAKGYDLLDFLTSSKRRILDAKNPKGYIIGMLKTAIKTEQKTMF